jgi:DNA-binding MarR family transcriptional regulator
MEEGQAAESPMSRDAELDESLTGFYERFASWEEGVAEQVGLTPRQCHAVVELGRSGPIRMKPLADRLGITTGTLTVMVDRLHRLGMVERLSDPEDKRAFNVELSPAGMDVYEAHARHHRDLSIEVSKALSGEEARALVAALDKLKACL